MTNIRKPTGRALSIPAGLAWGGTVSLLVTLAGSALIAKLVQTGKLPQDRIGYGIMLLLLAASMLGALVSEAKIKRRKLLVCMLAGVVYFLELVSITALFFGGQYEGFGATALLVLGGSGTAALMRMQAGKGSRKHLRRIGKPA